MTDQQQPTEQPSDLQPDLGDGVQQDDTAEPADAGDRHAADGDDAEAEG